MSDKPAGSKTNKGGAATGKSANSPSIVEGLQSVMAVIGEEYQASPAESKPPEKPAAAAQGSSLKSGLQSVLAVIGEEYVEDDDQAGQEAVEDVTGVLSQSDGGKATPSPPPESRRDQEEGGELDSHEEASPEEIKRREVVLG